MRRHILLAEALGPVLKQITQSYEKHLREIAYIQELLEPKKLKRTIPRKSKKCFTMGSFKRRGTHGAQEKSSHETQRA